MPADHVLDASVAAKVMIRETETDAVRAWFDSGRAGSVHAPEFLRTELYSILLKRKRQRVATDLIRPENTRFALSLIEHLVPTESLLARAFEVADRTGASFYDALYLTVAIDAAVPLVTADQKLIDRVRKSGEPVQLLTIADLAAATP